MTRRAHKMRANITPRLIRLRDAPSYLGMDKNRFNKEVRPALTQIPIGRQGIAFCRIELDRWCDQYMSRNGRPAAESERGKSWEARERQDSPSEASSGTSTKCFEEYEFAKALEQARLAKPKSTLQSGWKRSELHSSTAYGRIARFAWRRRST